MRFAEEIGNKLGRGKRFRARLVENLVEFGAAYHIYRAKFHIRCAKGVKYLDAVVELRNLHIIFSVDFLDVLFVIIVNLEIGKLDVFAG